MVIQGPFKSFYQTFVSPVVEVQVLCRSISEFDTMEAPCISCWLQTLDLEVLLRKAHAAVSKHAQSLYREDPDIVIKYIVLDLPCTFFMIRTRR